MLILMLRIMNLILILALFTTQSAWAIQGAALDNDRLDHNRSEQNYTQPVEQHDEAPDACNHFCHAGAHLVGLISSNTIDVYTSHDNHKTELKKLSTSLNYQPPIPPPIS